MTNTIIVVRRFTDEISAQIAAAALEANGIPAQVSPDNAGGMLPSMGLLFPVRLLVRQEDEEAARAILDSSVDDDEEGG